MNDQSNWSQREVDSQYEVWRKKYKDMVAEKDAEIARLKDDRPGTPLGRFKWFFSWVYSQSWAEPYAARGPETQLLEYIASIEKENEQLKAQLAAHQEHLKALEAVDLKRWEWDRGLISVDQLNKAKDREIETRQALEDK